LSCHEAFTDPEVAVIDAVPMDLETLRPAELTMAIFGCELPHSTEVVMFCVLRSVYVPVAVSCVAVPSAMDGADGRIVMATRTAFPTLSVAELLSPPALADIVALPTESEVAKPLALMLATLPLPLLQTTEAVSSFVEPSLNLPIAVNCIVWPKAMPSIRGETKRPVSCGD